MGHEVEGMELEGSGEEKEADKAGPNRQADSQPQETPRGTDNIDKGPRNQADYRPEGNPLGNDKEAREDREEEEEEEEKEGSD